MEERLTSDDVRLLLVSTFFKLVLNVHILVVRGDSLLRDDNIDHVPLVVPYDLPKSSEARNPSRSSILIGGSVRESEFEPLGAGGRCAGRYRQGR